MINVQEATTKELVEFYNDNADKPVKKFTNRAKAEARVEALIEELEDGTQEPDIFDASKTKVKKAVEKVEKATRSLSEAIVESWKVEETRVKRSERSAVRVGRLEYPSVRKAFVELDLPLKEHISFRMKLKAEGKLKAYNTTWTIIPLNYD